MEKERKIPLKNYIILALVLILSIVIVIYLFKWIGSKEMNSAIINNNLRSINYNELDSYLVENNDCIIYISSSSDKESRKFESKFISLIDKYSLNNKLLYLNLDIEDNNKKNIKKLVNKSIDFPLIIVFKNKEIVSVYDIKNNNYNINKVIDYLKEEGIIND